jgi:TonB family protein
LGYNTDGTVVVYVTIDSKGNVTSAEVRDKGTTTQDATLRRLAREAALKAKFNVSSKLSEGGYITYKFNLH